MKRLLVIGNSDFGINLFKTIVYGDNIKNYPYCHCGAKMKI